MEEKKVLKIKDLCKFYELEKVQVKALDNVNLEIEEGEFIAIVGASGSGKSTLLHIIGGVDKPTSGNVFLENEDIYNLNDDEQSQIRRNKISIIYQFYNLIPTLNVRENIILPTLLDNKQYDANHLDELINLLGLSERIAHLPNELSGGQQQKVAIARALMNKPRILLADEPTGNLDSSNSKEIMELLKKSNEKYHQTIVIVTHDSQLARYANRIITISDGKIIKDEMVHNESN